MKELKKQIQAVADTMGVLAKQFDILSQQLDTIQSLVPGEEAATPVVEIKKAEARPKVKAAKSEVAVEKAPKAETPVEEEPSETPEKPLPVLATVLDIVRRSRKGVNTSQIKKKTQFSSRQISNALYKLSRIQNKIEAKSRGLYVIKKK